MEQNFKNNEINLSQGQSISNEISNSEKSSQIIIQQRIKNLSIDNAQIQQQQYQINNPQKKQIQQQQQQINNLQKKQKLYQIDIQNNYQSQQIDQYKKWHYLQHHGVTFAQRYQIKNLSVTYQKQGQYFQIQLPPEQQELAWYWCQSIGTQYQKNPIYIKNFEKQFLKRFKQLGFHKFQKFDFTNIRLHMETLKQQKKLHNLENKQQIKLDKQRLNNIYNYAIVDGLIQKTFGFIQPPSLFKGRGQHPKAGMLKPYIYPQQITLNMSSDAPIPTCGMIGHSWKQIIYNPQVTWLSHYNNLLLNLSNCNKYTMLSSSSHIKGIYDKQKYQKARQLKDQIQYVRKDYTKKIYAKDRLNKELGTAAYLIDMLALRVGNQKTQQQADTVGCCSLRNQHLKLLDHYQVSFDFLGKDSMRYQNTLRVDQQVWENFRIFTYKRRPQLNLFSQIDAPYLNDYLKSLMSGLTAKVFRTYNASSTLQQQLNLYDFKNESTDEKIDKYNEANRQVAILCNHQRTVGKKVLYNMSKKELQLQAYRKYIDELKQHKAKFTSSSHSILQIERQLIIDQKSVILKYPSSLESTQKILYKIIQKVKKQQNVLKKREQGIAIALGTSKTNYNDPRITVAWCKRNQVPLEKVFNHNLISKFVWAMHTQSEWQF